MKAKKKMQSGGATTVVKGKKVLQLEKKT